MHSLKVLVAALCLQCTAGHGQEFRSVGGENFRILDTSGFCLYRINKLVQGEKIARAQDVYYFSERPDSPLLELTRSNLENAFAGNARFRYSLEAQFRNDRQLTAYDPLLKTYKVEYVYRESVK